MVDQILSSDGTWMWTGSEWIPAPPQSTANQSGDIHDSVVMGDVNQQITQNITQNNPDDFAKAMVQAFEQMGLSGQSSPSELPPMPLEATHSTSLPPRSPSPAPVAVAPRIEARPLHPAVAAAREPVAQASPDQLREFMQAANMRHPQREAPSGPLSSHEQRFQQSFGDPHQRMLDQYLR